MPKKPKELGKKLREFSLKTRLDSAEKFKEKVIQTFKGYIKAIIVWGSITRGDYTGKSDVDIYLIFDDTKFPLKKFDEIREKIDRDLAKFATGIDPRLHPQPIIALTEFWDGIRGTHPLFFNIVREGYAVYDTGFFIPMRKLLEWGKFPSTVEAAEIRMESVPKRIARVQNVKLYMIAEDLYYAMLDAAQSILMYVGVGPPPPKTAAREVRKHLVENGLLEEEYAQMLEDVIVFRKKVEYKEVKEISGKEVDEWINKTDRYVKRFEKLLGDLEVTRKVNDIKRTYEVMIKASVTALKSLDKLPKEPEKLPEAFKKYLIEGGLVAPMYGEVLGKVIDMRKLVEDKQLDKVTDRDVYMSKEYVRRFLIDVRRIVDKPVANLSDMPDEKIEEAKKLLDTAKDIEKVEKKSKEKLHKK
jgi:uncharacterized protein (UPF0332 family)/predicted nucleotidyltransferase